MHKLYKLKLLSKSEVAPNILLLHAESSEKVEFLAGQYFSIRVAEKINRAYSTSSAPHEKTLQFIVDITPNGPGSFFMKNILVGDEFEVLGAFGFFTLENTKAMDNDDELVFVATGTGIAPFRSMILDLIHNKKLKKKISLYFGLRHEEHAYYFDEFKELDSMTENFTFIPVLSRPNELWKGAKGYCQDILIQEPVNHNSRVYICGRTENVKSIAESLLEHGYNQEKIFFEKYG